MNITFKASLTNSERVKCCPFNWLLMSTDKLQRNTTNIIINYDSNLPTWLWRRQKFTSFPPHSDNFINFENLVMFSPPSSSVVALFLSTVSDLEERNKICVVQNNTLGSGLKPFCFRQIFSLYFVSALSQCFKQKPLHGSEGVDKLKFKFTIWKLKCSWATDHFCVISNTFPMLSTQMDTMEPLCLGF